MTQPPAPRTGQPLSVADILRQMKHGGLSLRIDYETFCKIRLSHRERGLTLAQMSHELGIHPQTVAKYLALDPTILGARRGVQVNYTDSSPPSSAGWSATPTARPKSSSACKPRRAIKAALAS